MLKKDFLNRLETGEFDSDFEKIYGSSFIKIQRERYKRLFNEFEKKYPGHEEIFVFSAPGRTEIGGNHTDHQHGCVLAAAVNLDAAAIVSFHEKGVIRIKSEGYPEDCVELDNLDVHKEESGSSAALIRGIASQFSELGVKIGGFDAVTSSDVLTGSGLSSSAAFEVLVGTIIDRYYNGGKAGAEKIAKIGQFSENVYFGKKSGLMDQMVSSVGGFVFIDFCDTEKPEIKKCSFDFEKAGYSLCITDTKGSHADLSSDYSAVPEEMREIAGYFGKKVLREVDEEMFYEALPKLRNKFSHRAILRSAHFFGENQRAVQESDAVEKGDINRLLELVRESGESSANLLQNLYSCHSPEEQGIPLGLMISKRVLGKRGAARVHGGGFAGTIQAFVPLEMKESYVLEMNRVFGAGSCCSYRIRPVGGTEII